MATSHQGVSDTDDAYSIHSAHDTIRRPAFLQNHSTGVKVSVKEASVEDA